MPIESLARPALPQWRIGAVRTADWLVAAAIGSSSIVFSEPAIADLSMLAVIVLLPALGVLRFGAMTLINVTIWLIVAVGIAALLLGYLSLANFIACFHGIFH